MSILFPILGEWRWGGGPDEHRKRPLGNWQSDNAVDIMARAGQVVIAPVSGRIVRVSGRDPRSGPSGTVFGRSVTIQEPNGRQWFLTHLGDTNVRVGQFIGAGAPIARVGDWGGNSHLHLGVSQGDPRGLLGGSTPVSASTLPASATASGAGCITVLLAQLMVVSAIAYAIAEVFV